jgi:Flp pilus assembly pilin Flp
MSRANTDKSAAPTQASWRALCADESGVTSIEYGLIAALITIAATLAFTAYGEALEAIFKKWSDAVLAAL